MVSKSLSVSERSVLHVFRAAALANVAAAADAAVAAAECSRATWAAAAATAASSSSPEPWHEPPSGLRPGSGATAVVLVRPGSCTFMGSGMSLNRAVHWCEVVARPATLSGVPSGEGGASSSRWCCRCHSSQSCADDATGGGGGVAQSAPAHLRPSAAAGVDAFGGGRTTILGVPDLVVGLPAGEPGPDSVTGSSASKLRSSSLP
mmetsp:Transcript_48776/g.151132  ORF Transcript_48776/g.151132 Transcript_48776/m.151132 type:complete len:205 (-) Transcript_48776:91-705(-)